MSVHLDYPFSISSTGGSALTTGPDHVRDLIEQILFTAPGERVNRPTFGTSVMQLVFAPNSAELAGALEYTLQSALQQWLSDLIAVEQVAVSSQELTIQVTIAYRLLPDGEVQQVSVERRTGT